MVLVGLVMYYENDVKAFVIKELNKNLNAEVKIDPNNIDLTFVNSFPKCALDFKDILILEALKKKNRDTLIYAGKLSLLFNIKDLFNQNYAIKKIDVSEAVCHLSVSKNGDPNYIFWKKSKEPGSDSLKFALENISLKEVKINYKNSEQKVKCALFIAQSVFSGEFNTSRYTMQTSGKAKLYTLQINKTALLKNKDLTYDFNFDIADNIYTIKTAELALNDMFFSIAGNFNYQDSLQSTALDFKGKNIDIESVLSLLPEQYAKRVNDYKSDGDFFTDGKLNYNAGKPIFVSAEFGIKNASVTYKPQNSELTHLNTEGVLEISDRKSFVSIKNISAELGNNSLSGNCIISDFNDPYIDLNANLKTDLAELNKFWPIDTLEYISGNVDLNAQIKGSLNEMKASAFSPNVKAGGKAELKNIKTKFKGKENEINVSEGRFVLTDRNVSVSDFNILIGKSDIALTGELPEFLNYLFDSKKPLLVNADLNSNNLILEDVLYSGSGDRSSGEISIPDNLSFNLKSKIGKLTFSKFEADSVIGEIVIKHQKLFLKEFEMNTMDGKSKIDVFADASGEKIRINADASLAGINVSKLFYEFNNFGQNTLNDKHLKGFATAEVEFSGVWNKTLEPDLKTIVATGSVTVERGELIEFKPLESLSKYVELNELKDIKFSTLEGTFDIKNQVTTLPKTSIKNSAMNIELWGTHSFNNAIDYHIKLLLSEMLASKKRANKKLDEELSYVENDPENKRCVFVLMTGTVDNPIIKYDRKGMKQKIKEDIKAEKQNLKQLLKEEFGLFKNDSITKSKTNKADQKFKIGFDDDKKKKDQKKKEEDDDDF